MNFKRICLLALHWLGCFLFYLATTLLLGGLLGAFLYITIGAFTHPDLSFGYRLSKGFTNGFLYAGVWAIGLSIVLCVMRGHRERRNKVGIEPVNNL